MYAPNQVRTNDWWPRDLVARWTEERRARPRPGLPAEVTAGMRCVLDAAAVHADDPFQGVQERRVLDAALMIEDMEERAARDAIERAGISAHDITLLLTHTVVPEYQLQNPACILHERLKLPHECLSVQLEATAYTVFAQLAFAEAAIRAGRATYALLVQSCALSRVVEPTNPLSVVVGDAATAIVVGPVSNDRGLLSLAHFTDGRYPMSLVLALDGPRRLVANAQQLWDAQLGTADVCKASVDVALQRAGLQVTDIDYLCAFQGTAWLQRAIANHVGAQEAKSTDVFQRFGYLSAAAIAASLYIGEQQGQLLSDDLVVLTGGGTGQTYGAAVLRWGND